MSHGLRPGAHFAKLLEQVRDAQLDRVVTSKKQALEWLDLLLDPSHEQTTSRHPHEGGSDRDARA
ncbi:MAG: hypothetical protein WKF75_20515 [Singulisphaera sp.]